MSKGWHIFIGAYILFLAFTFFLDYVVALQKYSCYQRDWIDWAVVGTMAFFGAVILLWGLDRKD